MDERLEKALKYANYKITLQNQKENLQTELYEKLIIGINGGLFDVNEQLLTFVNFLANKTDSAVLIDKNQNPIMVENLSNFLEEITSRYIEATNFYYIEYEKLKKSRSVEKLLDFQQDQLIKEVTNE